MASDLISDDFNRPDQELNGSVSAEGWAWEKVTGGANFIRIDSDEGKDGTPGVRAGSGISFRAYRPNEPITPYFGMPLIGCQVDVCDRLNSSGFYLLIMFVDQSNWCSADFNHSTGFLRIQKKAGGAFTILGSDTVAVPDLPYTAAFYFDGEKVHVLFDSVQVLEAEADTVVSDIKQGVDPTSGWHELGGFSAGSYAGIGQPLTSSGGMAYDNFQAGLPWLMGFMSNPTSALDASNPLVRRHTLDEQRRSALLGGRQNTILTSSLGLTDAVPVARIHLLGKC